MVGKKIPIYGFNKGALKLLIGSLELDTGVINITHKFHYVKTYKTSDGQEYTALNFEIPQDGDIPFDDQFQSTNNELVGYARRSNEGKNIKLSLLTEDYDPQRTYFLSLRTLEKVRLGERAVTTIMATSKTHTKFMAAINKQNL